MLRLARQLTAPEWRQILEELERLDEDSLAREDHEKAWAEWAALGPQSRSKTTTRLAVIQRGDIRASRFEHPP